MKKRDSQLIQEIKQYLDVELFKTHSIDEICRRAGINKVKLQTGFKELFNTTVMDYVIRRRMEAASKRIVETDDSIKEIYMESGYRRQRSFNKTFKAFFSHSPMEYRRMHQHAE